MKTLPFEVTERLKVLGSRVRIARKRRGLSVPELAQKARMNRNTLTALELGKPGIALSTFVNVLWTLGLDPSLDAAANPDTDTHGKALEGARRPTRARKSRDDRDDYDF
jgi:transcriptional regulator with XRE-family HTH domain